MSRALRSVLLAGALLLGPAASIARANDYVVTTATDGGAGSLRAAIISANASVGVADTITIPSGTIAGRSITGADGANPAATGDLDISDDLTITSGSGGTMSNTAVSATTNPATTTTDRVFEVTGGAKVTISRIQITGGLAPQLSGAAANPGGAGGGILVTDGDLTLDAVELSGNAAYGGGGGVSIVEGALTILDSRLAENTSEVSDGGAVAHPYTTEEASATVSITATNIVDNAADTESGGGIAQMGPGSLTLARTLVHGNTANWGGGLNTALGTTKVVDSRIYANAAKTTNDFTLGGGILQQAGALEITRTTISGNSAGIGGGLYQLPSDAPAVTVNSTFSGNTARSYGGAIATQGGGATVANSTFAGNTAPTGSALVSGCPDGGCASNGDPITLKNSIVSGDANNCVPARIVSQGHNLDSGTSCGFTQTGDLSSKDAKLGPLGANGGPLAAGATVTHALLAGSPAIDAGDAAACPAVDGRSYVRVAADCDIGAFEAGAAPEPVGPQTTMTSGPASAIKATSALFAFSATPATGATFTCWLDSTTPEDCTSPFTVTGLSEGPHTFHVAASVDGIPDPTPADWGFVVDTHAPTATVTAAAEPALGFAVAGGFVGTVRLTTGATDPAPSSGSVLTRCVIDPASAPLTYAAIPAAPGCPATLTTPGAHKAYVAAVDAAGNTGPVASTTFTILASPDTTITKSPTGPINHAPTFEFTATLPGATFECAVDGGPFQDCISSLTLPLPADGTYLFRVRARIGEARDPISATADFVIDTVAPTANVGVEAASDGQELGPGRFAGPVNLRRSITDPEPSGGGGGELRCVLDPPAAPTTFAELRDAAGTACPLRFEAPGSHTMYAAASDGAGNAGPVSSVGFTIVAVPDTAITEGPSGPTSGAPRFSFTSTIPGSTFECRLDGAAFQSCASPVAAYQLSPGGHHFAVRAISPDGGVDPTPATRTFAIEKQTLTSGCEADFVGDGPPWDDFCAPFFDLEACPASGSYPGGTKDFRGNTICSISCPAGAKCTLTVDGTTFDDVTGDGISTHLWMSSALAFVDQSNRLSANAQIECDSEPGAHAGTSPACPRSITISALGPLNYASAQCTIDRQDQRLDKTRIKGRCSATLTMEPALPLGAVVTNSTLGILLPAAGTLTVGSGTTGSKKSLDGRAARASAPKKKPKQKKKPLVATSIVTVKEPGPLRLPLKLSADAKKTLSKEGKLTLPLTTVFKPTAGGPTVTKTQKVTLRPAPKVKRCKTKPTLEKPLPCGR